MDRVLEIGGFAAGYCGRLFVQAGCEVVRVEAEPLAPGAVSDPALDCYLHAGKRRVQADDPTAIQALASEADVAVAEAPTASALAALGFDAWDTPVKAAITPFGLTGPKRDCAATPNTLLAMAGYTYIIGDAERPPLTLPGHYPEFQSGGFAFVAANASRLGQERKAIEIGMLETVMALSQFTTVMWHCAGEVRRRHGNDFWYVVPTNMFRCADGWAYVNVVPGFWDAFATFLERPELILDERFTTNPLRRANRDALHEIIAAALAPLSRAAIEARATAARVPVGIVQTLDDVLADPHLAGRDFWQTATGGAHGPVRSPRRAWRVNGAPPPTKRLSAPRPAPAGEGEPAFSPRGDGAAHGAGTGAAHNRRRERMDASHLGAPAKPPVDGPLRGVRILDLTHVWAGPLATRILADLGAEVVKIEAPFGRGPRAVPTELNLAGWLGDSQHEPWNGNAVFVKLQRNKRSVGINLKGPAGRSTFLQLASAADVVIENFSARAMPALGLGYDALKAANPAIIHIAMPGFGTQGPYRDRVAFGPTVEVMSGLTHVLGYAPGEPRNTGMALMDPIAAVNAAAAVVAALRERDASGRGAFVEMALHESGAAHCGPWLIEQQLGGAVGRIGNRHRRMAPHGVYPCAGDDAWVAIACRGDADWQALCNALGNAADAPLGLAARAREQERIDAAIAVWTAQRDKAEAERLLLDAGVPAGAVNATPDMVADAQVAARGFFVPLEAGGTPMPGNPIKMSGISPRDWTPCPKLGADNAQVLQAWLGCSAAAVADLMDAGVLFDKPPE